jgi:hypothetical protein
MSIAISRQADRVWILNVGDLKPYEREIEFFINYGWNTTRWSPDNLSSFVTQWAQREFGLALSMVETVTQIVANLTRFNARRKPELLNSTTYSLINYREWGLYQHCIIGLNSDFGPEPIMSLLSGQSLKQRRQPSTTACHLLRNQPSSSWFITQSSPVTT